MRYVELRNETRGIVVSCALDGFISISTHTRSHQLRLDKEDGVNQEHTARIYFPLAENEIVLSAWVRELDNNINIRDPAIIVRCFIPLITDF